MPELLGLVPVPVVPPQPPLRTAGSTLGWSIGILSLACLLGFAVITLRAIWNIPARKHETRLAAWLSLGGLVLMLICYVEWRIHHHRQDVASRAAWDERQLAEDAAQASLEETYGIRFVDKQLVFPMEEEPFPWEMTVELPDGTLATCWLSVDDGFYDIACGPDPGTSIALTPLGSPPPDALSTNTIETRGDR